jgi:hypothetical protein
MAELGDTSIYGNLNLYGGFNMSGVVPYTGATTGAYIYEGLPSSPAGYIPLSLPTFASGLSGVYTGPVQYLIPFYGKPTGI